MLIEFEKTCTSFLNRKRRLLLTCFILIYGGIACLLADKKLYWNDELYTLYFTKLAIWPDLWNALLSGADQIPPTFILGTKISITMFGMNPVALRLPEMIGFLVMALCLYRIVSIRTSAICGFLAMLFPLLTDAFSYAFEARPYALLLAFGSLAFLCWQSVASKTVRRFWLLFLALSLSGALMSHYYGILIFIPIALGELSRNLINRRADFPVWAAIVSGIFPMFLFYPLIQGSMNYSDTFWSKPEWTQIIYFYDSLLGWTGVFLILLVLLCLFSRRHSLSVEQQSKDSFLPYELVAAGAFALLPVFAILTGMAITKVYVHRYALPAVIGVTILIAFLIHRTTRSKIVAVLALLLFFAGFLIHATFRYQANRADAEGFYRSIQFLQQVPENGLPIVSWFSHVSLRIWHYGPQNLSRRVYYIADAEASVRYLGHDTIDRGLIALKQWFPLQNVQPYDFVKNHQRFFLYDFNWDEEWKWNWLTTKLLEDQKQIVLKARSGSDYLFLIE